LSTSAKNLSKGLLPLVFSKASSSCLSSTYYSMFLDHGPIHKPTNIVNPTLCARQEVRDMRGRRSQPRHQVLVSREQMCISKSEGDGDKCPNRDVSKVFWELKVGKVPMSLGWGQWRPPRKNHV
jgi:hypothetical protein